MEPLPNEPVDEEPQRTTTREEDGDSIDSFSTLSDHDFVEFSEWDAKFNRQGTCEVPPPVRPSHARGRSSNADESNKPKSNTVRYPNGRRGCKQLALLQRQLLQKKENEDHARGDEEKEDIDDTDDVQIVPPPPPKRQCLDPTAMNRRSFLSEETSDAAVTGCQIVRVVPGTQLSHPRHGCTLHRFEFFEANKREIPWAERTRVNMEHCSLCYCYVCEVKADDCTDFEKHCNANDRDSMKAYWKFQRHRMQEDKTNRHFRFQCAVHIFRSQRNSCPWPVEMWEQRSWFNKRFCRDCVCFVCNLPVLECPDWADHCK